MTSQQRYKAKVKERIRLSNEREANGLSPDPWVVEHRLKSNAIKKKWFQKNPDKWDQKLVVDRAYSKALPKKGRPVPHNKLFGHDKELSIINAKSRTAKWHKDNRERVNEYKRNKRQSDPGFKITCNLRKRLSFLLRKASAEKTIQTLKLLGCSMDYFLMHMESKFQPGMCFSNYGQWHIDHIRPCDSFDLTKPEDQAACFHYTNLQPLWAADNRLKTNKILKAA